MSVPQQATDDTDVLIAGAGPTGLVLALWLTRAGVRVRLVDKNPDVLPASRALVVHARTLELYRQLGIASAVVDAGVEFTAVNMWVRGRHVARAPVGDVGAGLTPFPFMVILPQNDHERLLVEELTRAGGRVERSTSVVAVEPGADGTVVRLRGPDGSDAVVRARYVAGCDGAHSVVREGIGVGFPGGTYERLFYVADMEATGMRTDELHVALDEADIAAVFPMKGHDRGRLLGTIRDETVPRDRTLGWEDVSDVALSHLPLHVRHINWFSTYRVHHRVASHFRRGPIFLLGDAAHIHSPVGGQGMNTGIGDAVNLAWKLADRIQGRAGERLLATYEPERIAFARRLVATTDRGFTFATRNGFIARFVRMRVLPALFPRAMELSRVRRWMFRTLSQTAIEYRASPLSAGQAGEVHGGDRLPWVEHVTPDGRDNFAPLESRTWQVHVYGRVAAELPAWCADRKLILWTFTWRDEMARASFAQDAAYLVRPDGYVAAAAGRDIVQTFERSLATLA